MTKPKLPRGGVDRADDIFAVGEVLGRVYEIRRLLGRGGMGQVFEAQDHSLDRRVAIKAAWPDLDAPPLRDEARALAAFRHPSLVTVHGLGVHRGIDYIVMERIYGVSLESLLIQKKAIKERFAIDETISLMAAVAEGLSVVHRAGLAHRDIKPGNLMLTPDHRVVLMDFGLVLPEIDMASQTLIAGSPPYMAAESLANDLGPGSGPLVDIYALGVTTFQMLTGVLPRDAPTLEDLYDQHEEVAPRVTRFRADVPEPLADVVAEMLQTNPGERPQTAESVAWQLRAIDAQAPIESEQAPLKLLVVDDDPDISKVLRFYAQRSLRSVEVETASDGEEALAKLREFTPDIMFLDLHLPRLNGIEVCMYMRGERLAEKCVVVSVSAGAQSDDRQLMHQLGIRHFLTKGPGLEGEVDATLREITAGRASR